MQQDHLLYYTGYLWFHVCMQEPLTISDGFMNDVLSYNISHFDLSTTNICSQSTAIPVSACPNGLCKHLLHVPSSHCNPSTTNITVTVTTMSLLGTRTSDPVTIGNKYYSYVCYRSNCMMAPQLFI